jgi:tetratricopeptide (TPR) repeat protein
MVYQGQGRFEEAAPLFDQAIEIVSTTLGEDNQGTMRLRHSQALFEQARGNVERAEQQLNLVQERLADVVGAESPHLVPVLSDLARLHASVGNHLAAEALWRQVLQINRAAFPEDRLLQAQDQVTLAVTLRGLGELDEAQRLVRDSLEHVESVRGPDHPEVAGGLGMLAGLVLACADDKVTRWQGDKVTAEGQSSVTLSPGHLVTLSSVDEAEALYRQARGPGTAPPGNGRDPGGSGRALCRFRTSARGAGPVSPGL